MKWLLIGLVSTLTSCSAHYHLRKAIKKDPSIMGVDTITVVDTVVLKPVELRDTVTLKQQDTVIIEKEKLKIKIFRNFDTIRVDAICEADTIVSVIKVPYEKLVYVEKTKLIDKVSKWLAAAAIFMLVLVGLKTALRK